MRLQAFVLASLPLASIAAPARPHARQTSNDPFAVLDPQNWVNPDNMTWSDFVAPPGTNWSDPTRKGTKRNFNIALITVDYSDKPFTITQPAGSDIFSNPLPLVSNLTRDQVPAFYRDLLNTPNELNGGHTLHEYWMGDSLGEYGVDLTVYGAYRLPSLSWQYGIDDVQGGFNEGDCPESGMCSVDLRSDAFAAWRSEVGNETADSYELAFVLSAGQDESSTWQEFGEMKFATKEEIPDAFGPPKNSSLPNYATTRYVDWTSWASASNIWPNAEAGSSTQAESSGMATFAHELSHLLGIGDNYNNPYSDPARRAYSGPWSMLDRGSFNGPGGPHSRWHVPPRQGGSMGSLHTMRDKHHIGLIGTDIILQISRDALADSGLVVAELTARSVDPGEGGLMGLNITLPKDLSPACNTSAEPLCDGGKYNAYNMEVVDRMGADSFCPDSGVLISKSKFGDAPQPFQWTIDANPQDIEVVDFYYPNGTAAYYTVGDYRQLADALFHAGTRSGSQFEYEDESNKLHLYVVDINRDDDGVLHYTVGVRSLDGSGSGPSKHGVELGEPQVEGATGSYAPPINTAGILYTIEVTNTGSYVAANASHPQDLSDYLKADIYRVEAEVDGDGWRVEVPNALATAQFGECTTVKVAVAPGSNSTSDGMVTVTVTSESDPGVQERTTFTVTL
ncbi:M6 metalloprotease [Lophiostoma macrostomum CBS 122681]|uniref:M6 metalloprotease n=1 Tax=Lophiostoma macrostomum CBS 122681 TaxID=1314788 RepID=A0A6A6SUF7_9PLEO|nr:M6 metalloprotease [Lophiostoma macrostomum CBS 122681]